jgi:hypothetical protein
MIPMVKGDKPCQISSSIMNYPAASDGVSTKNIFNITASGGEYNPERFNPR